MRRICVRINLCEVGMATKLAGFIRDNIPSKRAVDEDNTAQEEGN